MTTGEDPATKAFYADKWAAVAEVEKEIGSSPQLGPFLDDLTPGAAVLELGCGGGRDSKAILAAGFELDATDGCEQLVRQARAHLGHAVRLMRFAELDAQARYHGVWASACLLHVLRDDLVGILHLIHRALRPDGLFFASYKAGSGEGRDQYGRYFNYPDIAWLDETYRKAGDWASIDIETGPGLQHGGAEVAWHRVTAKRQEA